VGESAAVAQCRISHAAHMQPQFPSLLFPCDRCYHGDTVSNCSVGIRIDLIRARISLPSCLLDICEPYLNIKT
jgi:hypothetical protein